ncbi:TonB-dependent receptor [Zhongshania aquimaris]|uniref:TonB-dependent receptor n=1 Tax=Zhongshania aquimaris TaxID=2857107 RepID=A0ABS6VWC4_9GAMM|nr:TonB-dependent receptor [Zhongshania aquimaris]MBW2941995.1 TonB-dependent receptor [Zhongshania aquimaris]
MAGLLLASSIGFADEAEQDKTPKAKRTLEEIVVTAQKREEDAQSVPLSITALSGDDIVDKNMGDMNEVSNYVPNLDILAVPTFPSIYMRGLGSSYNRGFEQSVALLIDEVFYGRASYINQGLLDLSAIEVLRGPQGTLFGKNSSAGAIHFRTAAPEYDFGTNGDVLLGEFNLQRYRFAATGPLLDNSLAWRIALMKETRDGGVYNTTTGIHEEDRDNQAARLRLQWDVSADLSIGFTLNGGVGEQQGGGTQLFVARARHLAAMEVFDPQVSDDVYDGKTSLDHAASSSRESWDTTVKVDWTLNNGGVVTSISNYSWLDEDLSFDADFSPIPFLVLNNDEDLRQFSQELRFTSAPGTLEYVAGAYFLQTDLFATYDIVDYLELTEILTVTGEGERIACINASPDPKACQDSALDNATAGLVAGQLIRTRITLEGNANPVETSLTRFDQLTRSGALFGQVSWQFEEDWTLTLGGRVNYEEKSLKVSHRLINNRTGIEGAGTASGIAGLPILGYGLGDTPGGSIIFPFIIAGDSPFEARRERDNISIIPKASVQYSFSDDSMSYLTIARGFKSGGYNAQPVNDQQLEFDDEDALTYELGLKSEWLGGAARLNVSAFLTDFDGLQVATFNGVSYVVGNAAAATIKGLEFDAMLITRHGILLSANGALTDAVYDEFKSAPCAAEVATKPPCDLSGKPLRLAPDFKTTITAGYQGQLLDLPFITTAGINATYNTEVALATDLDPLDIREAGTTIGIQLGIKSLNDRWHVMLFGDNVSDREYLAGAQDAPAFRGTHFGGAYPAATFELEVGFRF